MSNKINWRVGYNGQKTFYFGESPYYDIYWRLSQIKIKGYDYWAENHDPDLVDAGDVLTIKYFKKLSDAKRYCQKKHNEILKETETK